MVHRGAISGGAHAARLRKGCRNAWETIVLLIALLASVGAVLAISQYKVAALRPLHLAAICPWEGCSDFYRDFAPPAASARTGSRACGAPG